MKKTKKKSVRKNIKKQTQQNNYKNIVLALFVGIIIGVAGYLYIQDDKPQQKIEPKQTKKIVKKIDKDLETFEEKTKKLEIEYAKYNEVDFKEIDPIQPLAQPKQTFHYEEPNLEEIDKLIEKHTKKSPQKKVEKIVKKEIIQKKPKPKKVILKNTPRLVIIIDDVTTSRQVKKIKNIGYSVNMAFLPPTSGHKNSAKIAKKELRYMIHLPLQASSYMYEEENTLHINDSLNTIDKRIKYLHKLYPKATILNNHTGSKFTSNKKAMDKLFRVLKKYNFIFIDSRTTAKTVAKNMAKKYGIKMYSRDIFLDNKKDKKYIQKQLKKAIKKAKKYGIAIAIGHPYNITLKTLKESKHLLKGLNIIYVDEL